MASTTPGSLYGSAEQLFRRSLDTADVVVSNGFDAGSMRRRWIPCGVFAAGLAAMRLHHFQC